jgi:hypothetical protein
MQRTALIGKLLRRNTKCHMAAVLQHITQVYLASYSFARFASRAEDSALFGMECSGHSLSRENESHHEV